MQKKEALNEITIKIWKPNKDKELNEREKRRGREEVEEEGK